MVVDVLFAAILLGILCLVRIFSWLPGMIERECALYQRACDFAVQSGESASGRGDVTVPSRLPSKGRDR